MTGGASAHADIGGAQFNVEAILSKDDIDDPLSSSAINIKARILRGVDVHATVVADREARFHDLLLESIKRDLGEDELTELGFLEGERLAPIQAVEIPKATELEQKIQLAQELLKFPGPPKDPR